MQKSKQYLISSSVILRAKKGDNQAFEEIYKIYLEPIKFVVKQLVLNEEIAKDITQEIFINVYKKIGTLKEPKAFHTWLYRLAYNTCFNYNRSKSREVIFNDSNDVEQIVDTTINDTSEIIENQRILEIVEDTLQELDEALKSVGMMKYFNGLKISEISEILEIPKGTVKSRLNRVRTILKNELKKKNITPKAYGVIFFSPQIIIQAYNLMFQQTVGDTMITDVIIKKSLFGGIKTLFAINAKAIGGITLIISGAYVGVSILQEEKPLEKNVIEEVYVEPKEIEVPSISPAEIIAIDYSQEWTKNPIFIEVITSNDEYDFIMIDGIVTNQIDCNGTYQVQLQKDGIITNSKEITITNIDLSSPQMKSEHIGNNFTIYLSDDISGVNPESIIFLREGVKSNDYQYDAVTQIITIQTKKEYNDIFYVYDYAGNELRLEFN